MNTFVTTRYCETCGIELYSKNNTESLNQCDECADAWEDDLYEDFDE
tara:strand:- start:191 stop:331 length:141 start_codon:yes stop_codon:yes gene_type:complete